MRMPKDKIGLILLMLFIFAANWIWLTLDTEPPWWDQADYLNTARHYAQELKDLNVSGFLNSIITFNPVRPPLPMIMAAPVYFFNYRPEDLAVMINILYLLIAFLAIFKICETYLNRQAALLSCFVLFMFPLVFGFSRQFLVDICLLSIVTLSIWLLLKCDYFRNFKFSLLLGFALGAGMLVKLPFIIFLSGPLIYVAGKSFLFSWRLKNKGDSKEASASDKVWLNIASCFSIAIILSAVWYLPNLMNTIHFVAENGYAQVSRNARGNLFTLRALVFYPQTLMNYGVSFIFSGLFVISSFVFFLKNGYHDLKVILGAWIFVPLLIFTFSQTSDQRFLVPIAPAVAIIIGYGVSSILNKLFRLLLIALILVFGFLQFLTYSFRIPFLAKFENKTLAYGEILLFDSNRWGCMKGPPENLPYHFDDIFSAIKQDKKQNNSAGVILLLSDHAAYNLNTLGYYNNKGKFNFHFVKSNKAILTVDEISEFISGRGYQYVIYKDQFATEIPDYLNRINQAKAYIDSHPEEFRIIRKLRSPDDSNIIIYKHEN